MKKKLMLLSILFWICYVSEIGIVVWWFLDEMKLTYLEPNPFIFVSILYLGIATIVRFFIKWKIIGSLMVVIPGVPILLYLLIILIAAASGTKWR